MHLAPAYDMLPMAYAPLRGLAIQDWEFKLMRPGPSEQPAWTLAAQAAHIFWQTAEQDRRISDGFRKICGENAQMFADAQATGPQANAGVSG